MMTGAKNLNSTSAALAARLFHDVLAPLAASTPSAHLNFSAAMEGDSYFRPAYRPELTRQTMAAVGSVTALGELESIWRDECPELLALVPHLQGLAGAIASERVAHADDPVAPSTLVYQMW